MELAAAWAEVAAFGQEGLEEEGTAEAAGEMCRMMAPPLGVAAEEGSAIRTTPRKSPQCQKETGDPWAWARPF